MYDRVDCQLIMGLATSIYFNTFIAAGVVITTPRLLQAREARMPLSWRWRCSPRLKPLKPLKSLELGGHGTNARRCDSFRLTSRECT